MTYDPDRTTVMPHVSPGFPITDELPVVNPRPHGSSARFLIKLVGGLVLVGVIAITAVVAIRDSRTSSQTATDQEQTGAEQTPAVGVPPVESPTTDPLPAETAGFWQVSGVPDGLNVRSEPGTQSPIVGALIANQRHVFATGERATVNGAEWKQISFGDDDRSGWVSARFLVPDTAPSGDSPTPAPTAVFSSGPSVVCFVGEGSAPRSARIEFTNRTAMSGVLRSASGQAVTFQSITGTLSNGQAEVSLTDTVTSETEQERWVFTPASVILGDGASIGVVDCDAIASQFP